MLETTEVKPKKKHVEEAASASAPVAEYQPLDVPPETAKEWATAKFRRPTCFLGDMVFHSQTIGMFTMKTDAGKTNWTIALGLALAYGKPFMEWSPVRRARVLYIEGESPKYRTQDTIRTQLRALGIPETEWATANFTLVTRQSHPDMPLSLIRQGATWRWRTQLGFLVGTVWRAVEDSGHRLQPAVPRQEEG